MNGERIVLGSGKCYVTEFTGTVPENSVIETEANLLGLIQGGATLEYGPDFYDAEDDLGLAQKAILIKEEVSLKTGIMTWCANTLDKLCATGRVAEDSSKKTRTIKIGGLGHYNGKSYLIRFVHLDAVDGDIRLTIVGSNRAGFSLVFTKDKETVIDAEFKAQALDNEGTKVIYEETIPGSGTSEL